MSIALANIPRPGLFNQPLPTILKPKLSESDSEDMSDLPEDVDMDTKKTSILKSSKNKKLYKKYKKLGFR